MAWFRQEVQERRELLKTAVAASVRRILRGQIVTMDPAGRVIPDGLVLIQDKQIVQVSPADAPVPPAFAGVPQIRCDGTIYPGLIELHNHPSYNAVPLWGRAAGIRQPWSVAQPRQLQAAGLKSRRGTHA